MLTVTIRQLLSPVQAGTIGFASVSVRSSSPLLNRTWLPPFLNANVAGTATQFACFWSPIIPGLDAELYFLAQNTEGDSVIEVSTVPVS